MIKRTIPFLVAGSLMIAGHSVWSAETNNNYPDFQEVYQLIKTHAGGVNEAQLNRVAVQGFLAALGPTALLVTTQDNAAASGASLGKSTRFENNIGYLRIAHVADDLPKAVASAYHDLNATNHLSGLVLDLRYADGSDYAAAGATADLFVAKAQSLLNWGQGAISSQNKTNAIDLPMAILVNGGTTGSAEALAAVLRSNGEGLILGSKTAGQAMVAKDFPLNNGEKLRVMTAPVKLGNGTTLSSDGVKPDIEVTVNSADEHAYYADAFFVIQKTNQMVNLTGSTTNNETGTNSPRRARFNEAELVREHRAGLNRDAAQPSNVRDAEAEKPLVSDPALARALDLLKGLAVVRQSHS